MTHFSETELLMGRANKSSLPSASQANLERLITTLNTLFKDYNAPIIVSSGYRPPSINSAVGGSKNSWHQVCAAADLSDSEGTVWAYVLQNLSVCKALNLYIEDPRHTPGWLHIQIFAPKSCKRIFVPNAKKPRSPEAWNGLYDASYDG